MRRLIGVQSTQPTAVTWRTIEPRDYFFISFGILGIGGLGTLIGSVGSYECPLKSIGLACPGCGCGRAVTALIQSGPIKMYEAQPTASALVMIIGLLLFVSALSTFSESKLSEQLSKILPLVAILFVVAVVTNFVYQISN
jgi:hypothetical protein